MLRVFECFAGIGTQRMALRNIGVDYEVVGLCEWEINAMESYEAIHGTTDKDNTQGMSEETMNKALLAFGISSDGKEPMTLSKIERLPIERKKGLINHILNSKNFVSIKNVNVEKIPDCDLFTFSFPCQSFSTAGKGLGIEDIRGTLALDAIKVIEAKRPKFIMFENVKGLISSKHIPFLKLILKLLSDIGYDVTMDILNAKDYGVAQNRERLFGLGVLRETLLEDTNE